MILRDVVTQLQRDRCLPFLPAVGRASRSDAAVDGRAERATGRLVAIAGFNTRTVLGVASIDACVGRIARGLVVLRGLLLAARSGVVFVLAGATRDLREGDALIARGRSTVVPCCPDCAGFEYVVYAIGRCRGVVGRRAARRQNQHVREKQIIKVRLCHWRDPRKDGFAPRRRAERNARRRMGSYRAQVRGCW